MQRFLEKNKASHSTICFRNSRGIAERALFGRSFHSLKGKIHGPIFVFLLGYAFGFAPLQPFALADFTASDSATLGSIHGSVNESLGQLRQIQWNTDGIEGDLETLHDDLNDVHRYMEATVSGNRVGNWPNLITGGSWGQNPLSILQQLDYMRYNLVQVTNLMVKLAATNDYTKAFTNTINAINMVNEQTDLIVKNLGNLAQGYALEDIDGEGYDNRISGIHYGNSSLTMADTLQFIAQGVGGIDTSGGPHYQSQAMMPLINTIIGWTGGFSNNNIQTNGIIGLLRQANKYLSEVNSMTNLVVEKIDEQINIISNGFYYVARSFDALNTSQTNLLYLASRPYIPTTGRPYLNNYQEFVNELNKGLHITNQVVNSPFYSMAFALPHFNDDTSGLTTQQKFQLRIAGESFGFPNTYNGQSLEEIEKFASIYHKYYGNLRGYSDTFSDESEGIDETREGASNLVAEATQPTTNSIVRLVPELTVTELLTDWDDFEGVEDDWKREHGPTKEELERIKGYFDASMEESQDEVTFQFDLDFGEGTEIHTGEWNLVADDETIGGMKSAGNKYIKYGASTIKGILVCLFVWHMVEMSIAVINGDAVVG